MVETFRAGLPATTGPAPESPPLGSVIESTLNRTFDPIVSTIDRSLRFGWRRNEAYDFTKYSVGPYSAYANEFAALPNDNAAVHLREQIDRSIANRQVLSQATLGQSFIAEAVDPVNLLSIPFGGPAYSFGRAALRGAVSVGAIESGREFLIQTTDPVATAQESIVNVVASSLFGAGIGAATAAPRVSRAQAYEASIKYLNEFYKIQQANENSSSISPQVFATRKPREERELGSFDETEIQTRLNAMLSEAQALRAEAGQDEAFQYLRERADEIDKEAGNLRQELGFRYIEDSGFNADDPYGIPSNWFTDSVFYRAITTPMKRALQSKYPTSVKKRFFDLAHDMGLAVNQNTFGIASEPSVFMLRAVSDGQIAKSEARLKELYGQVQQNPLEFNDWLESVTRKRITGEQNLSEVELKALSVLEDVFGREVEDRLANHGLIGTAKGLENKIRLINEEIDFLSQRRNGASQREIDVIDARIEDLRNDSNGIVRISLNDDLKLAEYERAMEDIVDWNKTWMATPIMRLRDRLAPDRTLLADLEQKFNTRGLTAKQQKLYDDVKARVADNEARLAELEGLVDSINSAKSIDDLIRIKDELDVTPKMAEAMDTLSDAIAALRTRIDGAQAAIDGANVTDRLEAFFPRFFKLEKIRAERDAFAKILVREYEKNPYVYDFDPVKGDYVRVKLSTDPVKLRERAEQTIDNILGEGEAANVDNIGFGLGRSKHFRHRKLDIPNAAILDYIETNPLSVLASYNARIQPRVLFQEKMGRDYYGSLTEMELDMIRAGFSEDAINKMRVDFDSLYRRIVGNVLDNPDAMNQKAAYILRTMSTFAFMGGAGLASLPDIGRIVMQYELAPMLKGIKSMIDMDTVRRSGEETRLSGSALEYTLGMYRLEHQVSNNFVAPKLLNSAQHWFYVLNGLTPLTVGYKKLSGLVMGHTLIDHAIKLTKGTITDQERTLLAVHGIDENLARLLAKAPWERNKEGLILPNTGAWLDHIKIPEFESGAVKLIESTEDGSPVGKYNSAGEYVGAFYNRQTNTIYFDRDFIEGVQFDRKAWLKPRKEGVEPLPDIFKTPRQWANFVMLHEINHSRFGIDDVEFEVPKPASGFTRIYRFAVKNQERGKVSDWVAQSEEYQNMLKATGRWFSDDFDEAMWYVKENPEGELLYVDIPTKDLEGYRVSNIVETPDGLRPKDFSARAEKELFVPREVADAADSFSKLRTAGYENKINELALADYRAAKTLNADVVTRLRAAINSGITNTVISATPADRPIITDGVVHIPMRIAAKFGLREDPRLKGYARIENGFLALPFQFYNFLFGSVNKTLAAAAHGQVKNRALGAATMLGLAYMVLKFRTPDAVWEDMSYQDQIARTIDSSGILPIYSDLFYRTLHNSLALGGPNITGGMIQPKFKIRENAFDVVTDIAGAGPSWAANVTEGLYKIAAGDYGQGASEVLRMLPGANLWFLKSEVSELAQAWRN